MWQKTGNGKKIQICFEKEETSFNNYITFLLQNVEKRVIIQNLTSCFPFQAFFDDNQITIFISPTLYKGSSAFVSLYSSIQFKFIPEIIHIILFLNLFFNLIIIFKMIKRKDQLFQSLKRNGESLIFPFLDPKAILNLALLNQKFYLLVNPFLTTIILDNKNSKGTSNKKDSKPNKKNKNKIKNQEKTVQEINEIEVDLNKMAINKVKQNLGDGSWIKVNQLPFKNSYLQGKIQSGATFFYKNSQTNNILFVNRSLVDPNLNYNRGGFNSDLEDEMKTDMYAEMFSGQINDLDFISPEALRNRQKQILEKIQKKKQDIQKLDVINYEQQFIKGVTCKKIAIILCFGGSFSLGIFHQGKCTLHKSDKKYVCRKKAGQRQLNRDKQSGSQIYSMGSQIRRDQEKKHIANVYQILTQNRQAIQSCDLVFLQAPGLNRLFIINDSQTLSGVKDRLRSVCMTAKKANYTEVQAIYAEITKISFVKMKENQDKK